MYPTNLIDITDPGVRKRVAIERLIVLALIDHALAEGYELSVHDGEERHPWTTDRAEVVAAIMETDEDHLRFRKNKKNAGWVRLVYGNDGWDVIADNTLNLEGLLAPIEKLALSLEGAANPKPDERNLILIKHRYSGAVLYVSEADTLIGADLRWANLHRANLSGADLSKADLREANLSWTDLSNADLSGANLSEVNLRDANLTGADLTGTDLSNADLSGADLTEADLTGALVWPDWVLTRKEPTP